MRTARLLACLTFALAGWYGIPTNAVAQTCTACWSDLNGDGFVGQSDLGQLLADWGQEYTAAWYPDAYTTALWYLNGNGADFSGNGNDLTIKHDRVAWGADGDPCRKWVMMGDDPWEGDCFNSDGGALTAPGAGCTYPGSGDWTVEAWLYFPSNADSYRVVSHYSEHWAGHDPYGLSIGSGVAQFQINDSGGNSALVTADISAYKGQWIHLAGVYRYQQDISLWLGDGQGMQLLATTATALVIEYLPSYNVYVGGSFCATSTGLKIDEVRISSSARYPELVEKIVFSSSRTGDEEIWMMDPDGGNKVQLTISPGRDQMPAISPDGTQIAFVSDRNGSPKRLFVMGCDGSNVTEIAAIPGLDVQFPSWTSDGRILFGTDGGLYSVDRDGQNLQQCTSGWDHRPFMKPDGAEICYDRRTGGTNEVQIFKIGADCTNEVQCTTGGEGDSTTVTNGGYNPEGWFPEATKIALTRGAGLAIMDADCASEPFIIFPGNFPTVRHVNVDWSPDGQWLVFDYVDWDTGEPYDIYKCRPDGSERTRLTFDPEYDEDPDWGVVVCSR